jgi:DNA polymerase I
VNSSEKIKIGFFDLESDGLLDEATKIHCGVIKSITGEVYKLDPQSIEDSLISTLSEFDVLIGHNVIGYDFPLIKKVLGWEFSGKVVDTLIMSRLLNPKRVVPPNCPNKRAGPHSIESWGWRVGRGKPEHNDWSVYSTEMLHRCSEDVEILQLVYKALMEEAKGGGWGGSFKLSFELFKNLQEQEEYGWLVDKKLMEDSVPQLTRWIARIDRAVSPRLPRVVEVLETKTEGVYGCVKKPFKKDGSYSQTAITWLSQFKGVENTPSVAGPFSRIDIRPTNLDSNLETKEFLLSLGWEPLEWNTNDAGEKTSPKMSKDDPFEGIESKLGRVVAKRVQCKQRRGIVEGLIECIRPDGKIPSVVNTLAATGRATHRNIVNIPGAKSFYGRRMRSFFTSRPGMVLVGTDSDSCQLRMLAGRMGNQAYINAIVNGDKSKGTDNHSLTMKICSLDSRDRAKTVMYCLLFGGGDAKLGKSAGRPGEGAEVRKMLYKGFDGLEDLVKGLTVEWRATAKKRYNPRFRSQEYFDGKITGLDGRPIVVPSEHMLLVYLLQSDEAIMMTKAYNKMCSDLKSRYVQGVDYGVCAWYHDEYTVECREEIAEDVKKISEDAIAWAGNFYGIKCPHVGSGKVGKNWYDIH